MIPSIAAGVLALALFVLAPRAPAPKVAVTMSTLTLSPEARQEFRIFGVMAAVFFGSLLPLSMAAPTQLLLFAVYGLATAVSVAAVALAVLFGAQAGARVIGGLQRWQGPLQTANALLIVGIGAYLTLSGSLGVIWRGDRTLR